jgi:acyl-CoA thioester hydrolase/1,4-dihydroxy-2-naphthoyl-CoA hydrolase
MEEAEHALWRSAGLGLAPTNELAFPRVAAAFEFRAPLRFDEEFDILMQVAAMGTSSIGYACRIVRDGASIATGTMTIVCVRPGNPMRAVPIPSEIVARLEVATPAS